MKDYYYDKIAEDYDNKRRRPWIPVQVFLKSLVESGHQFKGINVDLGCANGRHFSLFNQFSKRLIGIDNSIEFLHLARDELQNSEEIIEEDKKNIELLLSDMKFLPLRSSSINTCFSVASFHHIKSRTNRKMVMDLLFKILKPNGSLVITVWRKWQEKYKQYFMKDLVKRKMDPNYRAEQLKEGLVEHGDKYVPWTVSKLDETFQRFYHFFSAQEIKLLLKSFNILVFELKGGASDNDNFFILAKKT